MAADHSARGENLCVPDVWRWKTDYLEFTNTETNVSFFLKVRACVELMRQILIECFKADAPAAGMALHGWETLASDSAVCRTVPATSCRHELIPASLLWNLVVEVALEGRIASTSEYKTEFIVKVNILHFFFYTSKHVSSCCWECLCGVCIDLVLKHCHFLWLEL